MAPANDPLAVDWATRYRQVRAATEALCQPLEIEDFVIQSAVFVSPTRWHLAHTSWFFETFVLAQASGGYRPVHPQYDYLFNSYYNLVSAQFPRPDRGLLSRPTVQEVFAYRRTIDERMEECMRAGLTPGLAKVVELGLHHEQQHQELMLTDIKHVFSRNPLLPVYQPGAPAPDAGQVALRWARIEGGLVWIGHAGDGFAFDNEGPRHQAFLRPFELAARLTSAGEYLEFIRDGGYRRPELWLSDGWAAVQARGWRAPAYWTERDGQWQLFSLSGQRPIDPAEPVCHVSLYEADAYARWAGARLASEQEWELASADSELAGNFVEAARFHPCAASAGEGLRQMFGDSWEWTSSAYLGYPGYRAPAGAIGEYNGKFMSSQMVLRGGSCATPESHIRPTYRNFFPPEARWQFTGIRLAREV
jgi:ergothioneine biosynthesis protein EgtB